MDISDLLIRFALAVVCAGLANVLIPRRIPGKVFGLVVIGIVGVFFGEWAFMLLRQEFGIDHEVLRWQIQNVPILPAVIGSAVILYVLTLVLQWAKYT
jgi:uncharacterized membrane protein YeaQ/YmgE (transglycosylase-associated protein family)